MVVFEKRWKKDCPEKNLSEQRREPTTNSILGVDAAIWIWTTSVGGECSHHRAIPCSPVRKGSRIHAVMGNTSQAILPWTPIYSQLVDIVAQINQNAELIIDHCDNSLLFLLLLVPPVETSLVASGVEKRLFSRAGYWSLDSSIKQYRMGPLTDYCMHSLQVISSFQRDLPLPFPLSPCIKTLKCGQHRWISIQIVFFLRILKDAIPLRFFHSLLGQGTALVSWHSFPVKYN